MKRTILFFILITVLQNANAQSELSLHFMDRVWQVGNTNPAMMSQHKVVFAFPGVYSNFSHSPFSLNDFIVEENGQTILKVNDVIGELEENNILNLNLNAESFHFGMRFKKFQVGIHHAAKLNSYVNYPDVLFKTLWDGNAQYIGQAVNLAPDVQVQAYNEIGIMGAVEISKFSIGARVKILNGLGDISTENRQLELYTDEEFYQLTLTNDFLINTSSFLTLDLENNDFDVNFSNINDISDLFQTKNRGIAFDIGATFTPIDRLRISASVSDIGSIKWEENVRNYHSKGTFTFEGLDLSPIITEGDTTISLEGLVDTLEQIYSFTESNNTYTTDLPMKMQLSGQYNSKVGLNVGALIYNESYRDINNMAVAVSLSKDLGRVFNIGAVYSYRNNTYDNLGVNFTLKLGPVQLFSHTDNIIPVFNPLNARNINYRFGLNLAFGKMEKEEQSVVPAFDE